MFRKIKIKHPAWLKVSTPGKSIALYNQGLLPGTIAGWMITVGCKHPLRAIYGSDLRAAWALLKQATVERWWFEICHHWWVWTHQEEVRQMDKEFEEFENDMEERQRGD